MMKKPRTFETLADFVNLILSVDSSFVETVEELLTLSKCKLIWVSSFG